METFFTLLLSFKHVPLKHYFQVQISLNSLNPIHLLATLYVVFLIRWQNWQLLFMN